ncbi:uncharacterized protein BO72DRAFT_193009 [Aspergillus fijiensis CBS 313.89]|uniref:Secreted protein n=1 Tax=Aspergillus fijiensis CBS 313.89 TaxID=1448319 RepID=A0A8G1RNP2_9EURO|nr:uncharacterized protein BO72DRAFT_193009 [Aspergillus fijiensis CBS 313.89]RAK74741.1 hypothetical protein BO72DRAFT_193009 [Aspergillus fijiensis CBS 313.89]
MQTMLAHALYAVTIPIVSGRLEACCVWFGRPCVSKSILLFPSMYDISRRTPSHPGWTTYNTWETRAHAHGHHIQNPTENSRTTAYPSPPRDRERKRAKAGPMCKERPNQERLWSGLNPNPTIAPAY